MPAEESPAATPAPARASRESGPKNLKWYVVIGIGVMHVGAILAFFPQLFSWSALAVAVVLYFVTGGLGITLCFHRLLTHRSYKTYKPIEYFLTCCGCLAWQGGPIAWVGEHRLHHKHSDTDLDPHSPNHGFSWSHVFWVMFDYVDGVPVQSAAKDLQRDKGLAFLDKYFWIPQFVMTILLFLGGEAAARYLGWATSGLSWVIWGIFARTVFVYHVTWFVNSASHTWGYRNFETKDRSTNNWWVALLGFGEGWHNNHHAHQRSAAHGMRPWEFDLTYWTIRAMQAVGLAWDVVKPKVKPGDAPSSVEPILVPEPTAKVTKPVAPVSTPAFPTIGTRATGSL